METLKIYVDASVDCINESMIEDIEILPMKIQIGSETYDYNGFLSDSDAKRFYNALRNKQVPRTSMIPSYVYEQYFRKALEDGKDVIYLALGSGISSTYEQALLAKKQLLAEFKDRKIEVIDSKSCSCTLGVLAQQAIDNNKSGLTIEENVESLKQHTNIELGISIAPDLFYLQQGGRLTQAGAMIGTALNVKPIIYLNDHGKLLIYKKKRGVKQAFRELVKVLEKVGKPDQTKAYISHGDDEEAALALKKLLLEKTHLTEIDLLPLTPIIGSHLGAGALLLTTSGDRTQF